MGRSNAAARKKSVRLNRREKGSSRRPPSSRIPAPPGLEAVVIPDGRCWRNSRKPKLMWATQAKAAKALRSAQAQADARGQVIGREERYYHCPADQGGCDGYHLTSRKEFIERPKP